MFERFTLSIVLIRAAEEPVVEAVFFRHSAILSDLHGLLLSWKGDR
jgi:hypothetical protein